MDRIVDGKTEADHATESVTNLMIENVLWRKNMKAYAVTERAMSRKEAYSPKSAGWKLYDIFTLASELEEAVGIHVDVVKLHKVLERNGFVKAVRIRKHMIRFKEKLKVEVREIARAKERLVQERTSLNNRARVLDFALVNVRNMLRIPRESK